MGDTTSLRQSASVLLVTQQFFKIISNEPNDFCVLHNRVYYNVNANGNISHRELPTNDATPFQIIVNSESDCT